MTEPVGAIHKRFISGRLFGLSAAIFSGCFTAFFGGDDPALEQRVSGFLFFLTAAVTVANVIGLLISRPPTAARAKSDTQESTEDSNGIPPSLWRPDFWGLFVFFTILQANGLLFIANVGFIADSLRLPAKLKGRINILWPAASALSQFTPSR